MTEPPGIETCFLCGRRFQFGFGRYDGRLIRRWNIMVCNPCWRENPDGIVPASVPHLIEHLKCKGIAVGYNKNGWIEWPQRACLQRRRQVSTPPH